MWCVQKQLSGQDTDEVRWRNSLLWLLVLWCWLGVKGADHILEKLMIFPAASDAVFVPLLLALLVWTFIPTVHQQTWKIQCIWGTFLNLSIENSNIYSEINKNMKMNKKAKYGTANKITNTLLSHFTIKMEKITSHVTLNILKQDTICNSRWNTANHVCHICMYTWIVDD